MKQLNLIAMILLLHVAGFAQSSYPVPGETMPDFTLTKVNGYHKKTLNIAELRGKWVVLDFWNKGCSACVKGFPKVNKLQEKFRDSIQFIIIGQNNRMNHGIEDIYKTYEKDMQLNVVNAYDSVTFKQFGIVGTPHMIIIDPRGKVYDIIASNSLTEENLHALVFNGQPKFVSGTNSFIKQNKAVWKYLLTENEKANRDFIYRSVMCPYNGEAINLRGHQFDLRVFEPVCINLEEIFNIAYRNLNFYNPEIYSSYWRDPVLEIADSTPFAYNKGTREGYYNYSFAVSDTQISRKTFIDMMRADIQRYFRYDVTEETRMMPYWSLTMEEGAEKRLRNKGKRLDGELGHNLLKGDSITISDMMHMFMSYYYDSEDQFPILDETGYTGRIDVDARIALADFEALRKGLKKLGFNLEQKKKAMKVMVIRDPALSRRADH